MNDLAHESMPRTALDGEEMSRPESRTASSRAVRPGQRRQERMAQSFANIVAVLMRDQGFRTLRIADLEWLVLPAILSGQWRIAQTKAQQRGAARAADGGPKSSGGQDVLVPVAAALWASVSPEIDKRLSENLDRPLMLQPNEWATGDILWLIAVAGDRRAVPKFVEHLRATEFKGKQVKLRATGPDGKVVIDTLGAAPPQPPAPAA